MPFVNLKISMKKSDKMIKACSEIISAVTSNVLKKKPELISLVIDFVDPDNWIIGGSSLSDLGKNSFYLDITLTDETNTKDQKAEYIKAIFDSLSLLLGDIHQTSYVYIQDAKATVYGYGGLTQECRYHQ
ncbi:MAG: 4-oxalocrotonate tautomerase family protein [Legionellales bacterium]|nr:4-oxalocrotonate tautomerase family protein [Legionellales bacterium]